MHNVMAKRKRKKSPASLPARSYSSKKCLRLFAHLLLSKMPCLSFYAAGACPQDSSKKQASKQARQQASNQVRVIESQCILASWSPFPAPRSKEENSSLKLSPQICLIGSGSHLAWLHFLLLSFANQKDLTFRTRSATTLDCYYIHVLLKLCPALSPSP